MSTLWIHGQVIDAVGRDAARILAALLENLALEPLIPPRGPVERTVAGFRFQLAGLLKDTVGVFEAQPAAAETPLAQGGPPGRRALLLPAAVIDELQDAELWENACARFGDLSNIDVARQRAGLRFIQQEVLATIFLPGDYQRAIFVLEPGLTVLLGAVEGEAFATHRDSRALTQPTAAERETWRRLHAVAEDARARAGRLRFAPRTPVPPPPAPPGPLTDTWISLNKLEELGVSDHTAKRAVLGLNSEADLPDIMGMVPDDTFELLESSFRTHHARREARAARQREAQFSSLEVVRLSCPVRRLEGEMSFEGALGQLTQ